MKSSCNYTSHLSYLSILYTGSLQYDNGSTYLIVDHDGYADTPYEPMKVDVFGVQYRFGMIFYLSIRMRKLSNWKMLSWGGLIP